MTRPLMGTLILFACAVASVGAQTAPSLDRAEDLARAGRAEEARGMLLRWWDVVRPAASRRDLERGLWLRGRLSMDPAQADLDYRRIAIEHPGGRYSDEALLRLAQSAHARGAVDAAALALRRLRSENPSRTVRRETEDWLARVGPLPEPAADADHLDVAAPDDGAGISRTPTPVPPLSDPGVTQAPNPVLPIPDSLTAVAPTAAPADDVSAQTAEPPTRAVYAVQLGAFSNPEGARRVLATLVVSGGEGRLVRLEGSPLVRVRTGRFATREEAAVLARSLAGRGFAVVVVRNADQERPVGP
jgi:cell division septation protein DedD